MAGDWVKVEKLTAQKREIAVVARKLGVSHGDAFLQWFLLYRWLDGETGDGFVRNLSGCEADTLSGAVPGTCDAFASEEVGWLQICSDGIRVINWERHNGKSAKARALDSVLKRGVRQMSGCEPDKNRTREEGRARGREEISPRERKRMEARGTGSAGLVVEPPSPPVALSREDFSDRGEEESGELLDLSAVDWGSVAVLAEAVAVRVPPRTTEDRRAWLRYAVLATVVFSEFWLLDSAEAARNARQANGTKKSRQAHFVATLTGKAADMGTDAETLKGIMRRIEIPTSVWKSNILPLIGRTGK